MVKLDIEALSNKNEKIVFNNVVDFSFQSDRFSPADTVNLTVLDNVKNKKITKISIRLNNIMIFDGLVDVQKSTMNKDGIFSIFICRSCPCLMLDNEIKPTVFNNLSAVDMLKENALSFGVNAYKIPYNCTLNRIIAKKGISRWEFINLFCKKAFGKTPFIARDYTLSLEPTSNVKHYFSNDNGISFFEASVLEDRYTMISKLYVKTGENDFGAEYNGIINNNIAKDLGIKRERYYNPTTEWLDDIKLSAKNVMREHQINYREIEVKVLGINDFKVGDLAQIDSDIGNYQNLYISQVKIMCNDNGYYTRLRLWDRGVVIE